LPWNSGVTTLIGDTHCALCLACRNAWHAYFLTLPEYEELCALKSHELWLDGRAKAGDAPSEMEWQAYFTTQKALLARFFALGQAWLAVPVAAP
jgi:hypothetical protein